MSEQVAQTSQESLKPWLDSKTYYQILVVTPPDPNTKKEGQNIQTKIVAKTKEEFDTYRTGNNNPDSSEEKIASHLPSPGVTLEKEFLKTIFPSESDRVNPEELEANNFYASSRSLLQSRKLSQLIANTWYRYLAAKKSGAWKHFINGNWNTIDSQTLNGLIAREIFFIAQSVYPSELEPENLDIYYPLRGRIAITQHGGLETRKQRFLILPNSTAWERIALSLLLAGQAYRQIGEGNSPTDHIYQQISEPIFSTGEIIHKYGLDVVWSDFVGKISEVQFSPVDVSTNYQVLIPYPPIPDEKNLSLDEIEKWAKASDKEAPFPFYRIREGNRYVGIDYVSPPYPYIPLSTS